MKFKHALIALLLAGIPTVLLASCDDDDNVATALSDHQQEQLTAAAANVDAMNSSILFYQKFLSGNIIVGVEPAQDGHTVDFSDGSSISLARSASVAGRYPAVTVSSDGNWMYSIGGAGPQAFCDEFGTPANAFRLGAAGDEYRCPTLRLDDKGTWQYSLDGAKHFRTLCDRAGQPVSLFSDGQSLNSMFGSSIYDATASELYLSVGESGRTETYPVVSDFYLRIKNDGEGDKYQFILNEIRNFEIEYSDIEFDKVSIKAPEGWLVTLTPDGLSVQTPKNSTQATTEDIITFTVSSPRGYVRTVRMPVVFNNHNFDDSYCEAWKKFAAGADDNILLDFSYAGYMHGEVAPPDAGTLGYKVVNVCDFGAVPDDGKSDRTAFIQACRAAGANVSVNAESGTVRIQKGGDGLKAIIYFPEGVYDLLCTDEEVNKEIHITASNYIIKGAGRDKTTIRMTKENKPVSADEMWSCPSMLSLKHYSALGSKITDVTGDAAKGAFSVEVGSILKLKAGDWVALCMKNNSEECIDKELAPYSRNDLEAGAAILTDGVEVVDYHQVASVQGNTVTFVEPIMHEVESRFGWTIREYPHYEGIGVEDLCFEGDCKDGFVHHESASDDSGFKLIDLSRSVNCYMRRVDFVNVSEALSVTSCANVSVYDVEISGRRGHAAVRSAGSSRVFIGKVYDHTSTAEYANAGQYHGCGVSKTSMGAVIWNVTWGDDSNFESHATQPRATLIDRCTGSFVPGHQGGDRYQLPNHLNDLTIWNMNATRTAYEAGWNDQFIFWVPNSTWVKTMPPVIVGFHGSAISFAETFSGAGPQYKYLESNGAAVEPESLYEAQIRRRLGYVPGWLNALK